MILVSDAGIMFSILIKGCNTMYKEEE